MTKTMNELTFSTLLSKTRQHHNAKLSITNLQGTLIERSFTSLTDDVQVLANKLKQLGIGPTDIVALMLPNCYEYILWDLALIEIGAISCVLPVEIDNQELKTITNGIVTFGICAAHETIKEPTWFTPTQFDSLDSLSLNTNIVHQTNSDLLTYSFSSGSSGYLKGLKISRKGTEVLITNFSRDFSLSSDDRHLIFLPFSNYQQRLSLYACLTVGVSLAVTSFEALFRDIKTFKPTFIIAPPAIYENIHRAFSGQPDAKMVIQQFFGGRIRFMITGMAPIPPSILTAYQQKYDLALLEAYGVTETGMIAWNTFQNNKIGSVGQPIDAKELVITDENEIVIYRNNPLSLGYFYCRQEDQQMTYLADGGIATGDIGHLDQQGFLTLTGRKKDLIITDAGVKLQPEEIEKRLFMYQEFIQSVVLWCDRRQALVAVIVVDEAVLTNQGKALEQHISDYNETAPSYKKLTDVIFTSTAFSVDNGMLTRNLKLSRKNIHKAFL